MTQNYKSPKWHTRAWHKLQEKRYKKYLEGNLDGAPTFNGLMPKEKQSVLRIFQLKNDNNEFSDHSEDKIRCIEESAQLYHLQGVAFQDVLTKKGFEVALEAIKDYNGRIAFLSKHGTLAVLGFPKFQGYRSVDMHRIHNPRWSYNAERCKIVADLMIGNIPYIQVEGSREPTHHSCLRGLAINPNPCEDSEHLAARTVMRNYLETLLDMSQSKGLPFKIENPYEKPLEIEAKVKNQE